MTNFIERKRINGRQTVKIICLGPITLHEQDTYKTVFLLCPRGRHHRDYVGLPEEASQADGVPLKGAG